MPKKHDRSFLKWTGSKYSVLNKMFKHIPREGETLIEVFCGSCVLSLNTNYENYILNDGNADLIQMYKEIVADPLLFIDKANELFIPSNNIKEKYFEIRHDFNNLVNQDEKGILFYWLIQHSYQGLSRYSKKTGYNVPWGKYKKPQVNESGIKQFGNKFKNAQFKSLTFDELLEQSLPTAEIYCDPPYFPLSKTANFTSYAKCGFSLDDNYKLNEQAKEQARKGSRVYICNHKLNINDEIYSGADESYNYTAPRNGSKSAKSIKKVWETVKIYNPNLPT